MERPHSLDHRKVDTRDGAVITLTRLSGQRFALNPDLMERIEATPDSVITLVDGTRHVVAEGVEDVVALVRHHRAEVLALAQHLQVVPTAVQGQAPVLRLIAPDGGES